MLFLLFVYIFIFIFFGDDMSKRGVRPSWVISGVVLPIALYVGVTEFVNSVYYRYFLQYYQFVTLRCQSVTDDDKWLSAIAKDIITTQPSISDTVVSLSLAYVAPTGELTSCQTGWRAEAFHSEKTDKNTVYHFASVTKVFTAEIVLDLVRQGRLALTDKLIDILPELTAHPPKDPRVAQIDIGMLLSHRAGFDRQIVGIADVMLGGSPWCPTQVGQLLDYQLQFTPNQKYAYSNMGYCLLSRVIEEKYQQPYREVVRQFYDFKNHPSMGFSDSNITDVADSAMRDTEQGVLENVYWDFQALSSSAGLYGSAIDLVKSTRRIDRQQSPTVFERGQICDTLDTFGCVGYGGNLITDDTGLKVVWRSGSFPVTASVLALDNQGGTFAFLSNVAIAEKNKYAVAKAYYEYRLEQLP